MEMVGNIIGLVALAVAFGGFVWLFRFEFRKAIQNYRES